ncbi:hypothetical protein K3169_10260 [Pseudomonas phytophila]|uniref:Imm33-like domain-containing protein n=1 Tax=Pseudomonas phytophila TaxID=2867264 RepID=A0ABY6FKX6_9PSED|nr:hypothetical protein [Pseudomonas phytophila]UXZ98211.1 hypothetical protein K3169_10260 [Pseudomonas phytophila]
MKIINAETDAGVALKSEGLLERFGYEISVNFNDTNLRNDAIEFIDLVVRYIEEGHQVASGETLGYGSWITKMELNDNRELIFFEQVPLTDEYALGISTTLRLWIEQHSVCSKVGADFTTSRFEQLIVISDGVLEGEASEGVRYPSPEHMSGWWITTDKYNGDTKSLKTVHAPHLAVNRPDLVKYLGLPNGYRFHELTNDAWFDEKVVG